MGKPRLELKAKLMRDRLVLLPDGFGLLCAYCGLKIDGMPDMHEVFLTKGDVQGTDIQINVEENCALLHPTATHNCHVYAATKDGQRRMYRYMANWAGGQRVARWLLATAVQMKTTQALEAYRCFIQYLEE